MGQLGIIVVYVVALGALMYFFAIKPQKKQQKEQQQLAGMTFDEMLETFRKKED